MDETDLLAEAEVAHAKEVESLADLDDEQLAYLGNLHQIPDPLSDGLDCETEVVTADGGT